MVFYQTKKNRYKVIIFRRNYAKKVVNRLDNSKIHIQLWKDIKYNNNKIRIQRWQYTDKTVRKISNKNDGNIQIKQGWLVGWLVGCVFMVYQPLLNANSIFMQIVCSISNNSV